jgi:CCR4-NOT transcriptional regulation complex NOT5 subunit
MASTIAIPPRPPNLRKKRDAHPGRVDQARAKRSSEEVQKAKADKAAKKQEASERRDASVKKAAAIELAKEVKDLGSELTANHPPPNTTQKVLRTRPEKATTTVTELDAGEPHSRYFQ